jgi:hypothetical protein
MKKIALMLAAGVVLFCGFAPPEVSAKKPLPPLKITIQPLRADISPSTIRPNDVLEFRISAVSFLAAENLTIEVDLTEGTRVVAGETGWSGPAAKNEEKTLLVTIQAPEKGKGAIKARASLSSPDGTRFSAEAEYELGVAEKAKPLREGVIKKDKRGRKIIEYR